MPGVPAREIRVLEAQDDADAMAGLAPIAAEWIGFDTICLYHGERFIQVLSNPALGFPQDVMPLAELCKDWGQAA
ncbi:MAG: hypothetical protein ACREEY_02640 [Brevundimonas sp.]